MCAIDAVIDHVEVLRRSLFGEIDQIGVTRMRTPRAERIDHGEYRDHP